MDDDADDDLNVYDDDIDVDGDMDVDDNYIKVDGDADDDINVYDDDIDVDDDDDDDQGVGALVPGDPRRRICEQRTTPIGESWLG